MNFNREVMSNFEYPLIFDHIVVICNERFEFLYGKFRPLDHVYLINSDDLFFKSIDNIFGVKKLFSCLRNLHLYFNYVHLNNTSKWTVVDNSPKWSVVDTYSKNRTLFSDNNLDSLYNSLIDIDYFTKFLLKKKIREIV